MSEDLHYVNFNDSREIVFEHMLNAYDDFEKQGYTSIPSLLFFVHSLGFLLDLNTVEFSKEDQEQHLDLMQLMLVDAKRQLWAKEKEPPNDT